MRRFEQAQNFDSKAKTFKKFSKKLKKIDFFCHFSNI
jgi:hypothetical protein